MHLSATEVALASVGVAAASGLSAYLATKRERRRKIYGEAVQAILKWSEMVYRVRRRDAAEARDLINSFHALQESLAYYEAWIASESKYMERSYLRLVKAVKKAAQPLIRTAWAEVRDLPGYARADDVHPDSSADVKKFMADVRSHLSPWPWRRWALAYRNRRSAP